MNKWKRWICAALAAAVLLAVCAGVYAHWFAPTRLLIVNAMPAREADIKVNSSGTHTELTFKSPDEVESFAGYDAVVLYGRSLYLDSVQMAKLQEVIDKGTKVYTFALRNFSFDIKANLSQGEIDTLNIYAQNANASNCRNMVVYLRSIATPHRWPVLKADPPVAMPSNMYYHLQPGEYFSTPDSLESYLRSRGVYHENAPKVAFISGTTFPVEGSRPYIDSLIVQLNRAGLNVYPLCSSGRKRAMMLRKLKPDAVVYLPMGRIGNDTLVDWLNERNIPLFTPFPLLAPRTEWLDVNRPVTGGVLNARVLIPEVDGGIYPMCIATQNEVESGLLLTVPEMERVNSFVETVRKHLALRTKPNKDKRIAIGFFRNPGKDALLASGLEVVPSLHALLLEMKRQGYDLGNLPSSEAEFARMINDFCTVLGDYAPAAQKKFMQSGDPTWVSTRDYEMWARGALLPEKYNEVVKRYGNAPGWQMASGDSLALGMLRFGNVVLFPQPRPALGDDDFKLVHGAEVAPPHNYIATYLYLQKVFGMDALLHFGTHGNLEFTPGKNVGLSQADWAEVLVGPTPHFYLYVTSNVGEAVIAKRRSHAVMVTHLTAPFVESGMRARYQHLLNAIHDAVAARSSDRFASLSIEAKKEAVGMGLHRTLGLDSVLSRPYSADELEMLDRLAEEIADEKITGANYVLGTPYASKELASTVSAICADRLAYIAAKRDRDLGKITTAQLQDMNFVNHSYLGKAKEDVARTLASGSAANEDLQMVLEYKDLLLASPENEIATILRCFNGGSVAPAPGGDPVQSPNVLPTGRNMYSVNTEAVPTEKSWRTGVQLADATIAKYRKEHDGEYPQKINYTFWAGEFISSEGATVAQALWMLGVEPLRDDQGRVVDLRLVPAAELGRPRIDVVVQVSGQLRDIAASRLKLITEAVKLAASADDGGAPNYVADATKAQEKELMAGGISPAKARELGSMRVFGPINSGYGTGMLPYTENSGSWESKQELVDGYVNNMCAMYGDESNWGQPNREAMTAALKNTKVIVQPRQSNTWGPVSLDHVYEFTGSVSLAVASLSGEEPDAVMADYRNPNLPRIQDTRQAVAIETRATLLNPDFVRERMKGGATTASMFGEMMRNVFGWSVLRKSALDENIYNDLFDMYVTDKHELGVKQYFDKVNPAAYQEMTATMLEAVRKGEWKASPEQIRALSAELADFTIRHGAPCTEFVCGNAKLQQFAANNMTPDAAGRFRGAIDAAVSSGNGQEVVLKEQTLMSSRSVAREVSLWTIVGTLLALAVIGLIIVRNRRKEKQQ